MLVVTCGSLSLARSHHGPTNSKKTIKSIADELQTILDNGLKKQATEWPLEEYEQLAREGRWDEEDEEEDGMIHE
jgi:hypothetical protein